MLQHDLGWPSLVDVPGSPAGFRKTWGETSVDMDTELKIRSGGEEVFRYRGCQLEMDYRKYEIRNDGEIAKTTIFLVYGETS